MVTIKDNCIVKTYDEELLIIEPWGENSLRVRSFLDQKYVDRKNALTENYSSNYPNLLIYKENDKAVIVNGKIKAVLDHRDRISFFNDKDELILKEFIRLRAVKHDDGSEDVGTIEITKDFNSTLKLKSREYLSLIHI